MLRSLTLALLMAVPALVLADDKKPEKAEKFDATKLLGDWKITDGMKAGDKPGPDIDKGVATVTKDKISLKSDGMGFAFGYKLDDKKDPVAIDMEILEPEGLKGAKALGIVKIDGDKFTLCYNPSMGGARPTKFESTKDNGNFLFVHTKAKPEEKKPEKKPEKVEDKKAK
jgi:uncharacterized protein (TIGR03067 family)